MRQGEFSNRRQLRQAATINRVDGTRIAASAAQAVSSAHPSPWGQPAPSPSSPTIIELGPGAASARA